VVHARYLDAAVELPGTSDPHRAEIVTIEGSLEYPSCPGMTIKPRFNVAIAPGFIVCGDVIG
jgi:hypothetical protein